MLLGRLSLWLCALLIACGQVPLEAQLFLVAQRADTNASDPGLLALVWDPSPDTNVAGYFLCWGVASGACTNLLDAGNSTNATVAGLAINVTYYFTASAYDGMGQESLASNEVSYTVPTSPPPAPRLSLGPVAAGGTNSAIGLSFQGYAGTTCQVQSSQDLQHWSTLWTTNCGSDGLIVFEVTDMANYPWRFYRVLRE